MINTEFASVILNVKFVTAASKLVRLVMFLLRICLNHRKETYGQILADVCRAVGIEVIENNSQFSELVLSNPCARKIRNLETYKLVRSSMSSK